MITITLEVDEVTDVAYQNLSSENKQRLNSDICTMLRNTITNVRALRLKKILEEIAKESGGKELNAEVLSELLRDED